MKSSEVTSRGKSSTTWTNRTPPIKGKLPEKMLFKETVSVKGWKLLLGVITIVGWAYFILTRS
jgi:hypothetical protein